MCLVCNSVIVKVESKWRRFQCIRWPLLFLPSFFFNSCKGLCWKKGTACSLTYLLPCLVSLCVIFLCCLCSCSKLMICERMSLMVSSFCFHISWVVPSTVQFSLWLSHSTGREKNSFRDENYVTNSNYFLWYTKRGDCHGILYENIDILSGNRWREETNPSAEVCSSSWFKCKFLSLIYHETCKN